LTLTLVIMCTTCLYTKKFFILIFTINREHFVDKEVLEQGFLCVSRAFPFQLSSPHCTILTYHIPLLCVIALTRHHIFTSSFLKLRTINRLVFAMGTRCVFCEESTGLLRREFYLLVYNAV
jgi:hypothetical protein